MIAAAHSLCAGDISCFACFLSNLLRICSYVSTLPCLFDTEKDSSIHLARSVFCYTLHKPYASVQPSVARQLRLYICLHSSSFQLHCLRAWSSDDVRPGSLGVFLPSLNPNDIRIDDVRMCQEDALQLWRRHLKCANLNQFLSAIKSASPWVRRELQLAYPGVTRCCGRGLKINILSEGIPQALANHAEGRDLRASSMGPSDLGAGPEHDCSGLPGEGRKGR